MQNIADGIRWKYPNASPLKDFSVETNFDGSIQTLVNWSLVDSTGAAIPKPSNADLQSWAFSAYQQAKINALSDTCNSTILNGFSSNALGTSHAYQFDVEAQANLTGQLAMINADTTITSINWKTVDSGVLSHTRAQFVQLCKDGLTFKNNTISHYWSLKSQVLSSTTEAQVDAITW